MNDGRLSSRGGELEVEGGRQAEPVASFLKEESIRSTEVDWSLELSDVSIGISWSGLMRLGTESGSVGGDLLTFLELDP